MSRMFVLGSAIVAVATSVTSAHAQEWLNPVYSAPFHDCIAKTGTDARAIDACENDETVRQDAALNAAYKKLNAILIPYQRDLLVKNKRAWINFRDSECAFQGTQLIGGPLGIEVQAQADMKADCLLHHTHMRVQTLNEDYKTAREGGAH